MLASDRPVFTHADMDTACQRADAFLEALEAIERRGLSGSIRQALEDIAAAYAKVEEIDAANIASIFGDHQQSAPASM